MIQRFPLDPDVKRPLILLDELFRNCTALIDTGALIPVWTKQPEILRLLGAELERSGVSFGGFGGSATGDLYRIDLKLGQIIYPSMPIVASFNEQIPGYFIFSATMFSEMDYTVSNSEKIFTIETHTDKTQYRLIVDTDKGTYVLSGE